MAAVNGEVGADGGREAGVVRAGERLGGGPVEAVVNDEKIDALGGGALEGGAAGVHGGADLGDAAVVFELEAVEGVGVVLPGGAAGGLIAEGDEVGEGGGGGHDACRAAEMAARGKTRGGAVCGE